MIYYLHESVPPSAKHSPKIPNARITRRLNLAVEMDAGFWKKGSAVAMLDNDDIE